MVGYCLVLEIDELERKIYRVIEDVAEKRIYATYDTRETSFFDCGNKFMYH